MGNEYINLFTYVINLYLSRDRFFVTKHTVTHQIFVCISCTGLQKLREKFFSTVPDKNMSFTVSRFEESLVARRHQKETFYTEFRLDRSKYGYVPAVLNEDSGKYVRG